MKLHLPKVLYVAIIGTIACINTAMANCSEAIQELDSGLYGGMPSFYSVQFGNSTEYSEEYKNYIKDINSFSISLKVTDIMISEQENGVDLFWTQNQHLRAHVIDGKWTLTYQYSSGGYDAATGMDFDGAKGTYTYVFRSDSDYMDLWRIDDENNSVCLVKFDGSLNVNDFVDPYEPEASTIYFGYDDISDLEPLEVANPKLWDGIYEIPGISNDNIPEPATATLSLLALVGLAARRRRK